MRILAIVTGALLLAGCTVGPDYHPPRTAVPAQFSATTQPTATAPTTAPETQPSAAPVDLRRWWRTFEDPMLDRLIDQAVTSNLDVRLAEARVREARAELEFNRAALFPGVDSSASYTRTRFSRNGFAGAGSAGAASALTPAGTSAVGAGRAADSNSGKASGSSSSSAASVFSFGEVNLYQIGFDAGWEIDVFGGTRRAIEASQATLEAQVEARRNALVTLLSEVARNYIALRGFQHELAIVQQNVGTQRDTLSLIRSRFQAGIATDLDVARQEAQVATTESQVPTLQTEIQQALHRLAVLLARNLDELEQELATPTPLPGGPPQVPPGLPSELLRRRPDVRQAERQLAAANANIGVAVAQLFPRFTLTGAYGVTSFDLKTLLNASSISWSVGPSVSWRLFDAGQLWANVRVQNARQQEALIQYHQTVLQALSDVEDALVAYTQEQGRRERLRQAVEANRRAVDLAKQLNTAGLVDFLNVLTAEQALYQSEDQLAQSEQTVSTNLVALYKALGGGWEAME